MFDQPPLNAKEVFGRGFVEGLARLFCTFLLIFVSMLPSRSRFYLHSTHGLWTSLLFVWPALTTIGCVVLLSLIVLDNSMSIREHHPTATNLSKEKNR